mmetsp:Transcript_29493/g.41116  ORF Transcript_29493/g.41116 Transcript_29493/m.41116 type:complete len:388 (-) Transcript_29493:1274-2437(-)
MKGNHVLFRFQCNCVPPSEVVVVRLLVLVQIFLLGVLRRLQLLKLLLELVVVGLERPALVLRQLEPGLDLLADVLLLEVKVVAHHVLEAGGRVLQHVQHGPLHGGGLADRIVLARLGQAAGRVHGGLVAGLVEVGVLDEDQRLDRHADLQEGRLLRLPHLLWRPRPGPQQAQAHLAAVVEVRVEAHRRAAGGHQVQLGRHARVLGGEVDVEQEQPVAVRRAGRRRDHHLGVAHALRAAPEEDRRVGVERQRLGQPHELGCQPVRPRRGDGRGRRRGGEHRLAPLAVVVALEVADLAEEGALQDGDVRFLIHPAVHLRLVQGAGSELLVAVVLRHHRPLALAVPPPLLILVLCALLGVVAFGLLLLLPPPPLGLLLLELEQVAKVPLH